MDAILSEAQARQRETIQFLKELVECESPSDSPEAVNRLVDLLIERTRDIATAKTLSGGGKFGRNLLLKFNLPGPKRRKPGNVLGVGHNDTVWPVGTLEMMPWREQDGRLWGPGVLDMKSGVAFFITAMRMLRDSETPISREVALWLVSDEEIGSENSRSLTEKLAKRSVSALVLEPGTGLAGKLKTARKGVGDYVVRVTGRASHAGVDFAQGASAIVELARQVERISGFTDLSKGLTVNPGVIRGGTRTNVIAAEAVAEVDIRIARVRDYPPLHKKFMALKAIDKRCTIEVTGGLNRPPMERNRGVVELYRSAEKLAAAHLQLKLEESATGGGSDGNFTAGLGVPTLDGIGGVGEGAHAVNESILVDRIADRTALLALLARHLGQ